MTVRFAKPQDPRILISRSDGTLDILWSQVFTDGRDINELAQQTQREYEVRGWTAVPGNSEAPAGTH
jgi:hypothetical protein